MAELELAVLQRQGLTQRLPALPAMVHAVGAWADRRTSAVSAITWQFTSADTRVNRHRLDPAFQAWRTTRSVPCSGL